MEEPFTRTEMLLGKQNMTKLYNSKVAVFGVGGVGGFVVEALVRSGINKFVIVDNDLISTSNLNRQIIATTKSIGLPKVQVINERILSINPKATVQMYKLFFLPETSDDVYLDDCDYIIDAIDTITAKIELVMKAKQKNIKIISSMGTGNKLNPNLFEIDDIYNTSVCPLAKVMRKELKKRGIENLKVIYSKEPPLKSYNTSDNGKQIPGSISFVPSVAGLIIASEVIKDLIY